MKYTGNYNLKKPEGTDVVNIEDLNENADIIDQALKAHDDALDVLDAHMSDGTQHAKTARFVVGTSTSGWTEKDCDYLCDGTDDQVEIQQALDALPEDGGEVVILDGTYNITAPISVNKNNVSIRGNGNATVLKRMWDSFFDEGVITLSSVEGCRVENLQIDGNKAIYTAGNNRGIFLSSSNNNTITGNTCNNNGSGVYLYSSNDNTITGNTCNNNNSGGIYLRESSNYNVVTDNTCNNNSFYGIYLFSSSSNNTITGNACNNNSDSGICLRGSSSDNVVTDNTCNNNSDGGIQLYSSSNNSITSNTCNNNYYGTYLSSSSNNIVTGNTCNNNNNSGMFLDSSSNNTVTGNTCNNNENSGIQLYSSSNDNTVTGNTCNNNSFHGIYLFSSSNNIITGNNCNDNFFSIQLDSSSSNTITGNTCIHGTGTPGDYPANQRTIHLSGTDNNYNLITSNNCMGKAPVIEGGTGNSVFNNKWDASEGIDVSDIPELVGTRLALGESASAWSYSVALGHNALAMGGHDIALGHDALAMGEHDIAIGHDASVVENGMIAIGYKASAAGGMAIGNFASAAGLLSVALGYSTSTGNNSVALGSTTSAMGLESIALGSSASAAGDYSVALGYSAWAENANEGILGGTGDHRTSKWKVPGDFTVSGTKNFEIPHPKPEKKATHVIRHGAVESPTPGDTLYRWKIQATKDNDLVTIDLPDYFVWLNKDVQIWVTGQGHFGNGYGTLNRETEQLEIHCQLAGEYNVLVIGTRNDDHPSVQEWYIKGVEREIGESWTGETYVFSVDEILEIEEIKEVSA